MDLIAEGLGRKNHSDLYHCHEFIKNFVGLIQKLQELYSLIPYQRRPEDSMLGLPINLVKESKKWLSIIRKNEMKDIRSEFVYEYKINEILNYVTKYKTHKDHLKNILRIGKAMPDRHLKGIARSRLLRNVTSMNSAIEYIGDEVEHFYFSRLAAYAAEGILQTHIKPDSADNSEIERLRIVDLPALENRDTRLLAVDALLGSEFDRVKQEWSDAIMNDEDPDTRVPTFIVVDEAHNLIPASPRSDAERGLLERFRTVVAEGRKYGLFLILVSQRPEKLDQLVLSECANVALMKLGSSAVLKVATENLGLDDISKRQLEKCLQFNKGRIFLSGPWSPDGPTFFYTAARRTVEGGKNLDSSYWAVP